jgi:hypothetical protein
MPDPEKVAEFARRMAAEQNEPARHAIQLEFLDYAAEFLDQFSYHYRDFAPREDGNIACMMDGYIRPRDRTAYIVDTRSGFIHPVDEDAQRGTRRQGIADAARPANQSAAQQDVD